MAKAASTVGLPVGFRAALKLALILRGVRAAVRDFTSDWVGILCLDSACCWVGAAEVAGVVETAGVVEAAELVE